MEEALAAPAAASVAASAAAETAKEAAAAAVTATEAAAASNGKEAAAVPATTGAAAAASAAIQASKKRKLHLHDGQDPPASDNCGDADHISRLPDAVLGSIVSLLATKEGARTQAISRRWRPLWRSAPLNLVVNRELINKTHKLIDLIPKVLSEHRGPTRRFLLCFCIDDCYDKIEGWLSSQALDSLQELQLNPKLWFADRKKLYPLPPAACRFSPTLRVAKFHGFHLPDLIGHLSLKFPCLEQLTLERVTISEDALQSMLSGCPALESLELKENLGIARLCISSQTLKSLGFCVDSRYGGVFLQELVIEDAPCLERLLALDPKGGPATIRIICAPKLEILGMLSEDISELHLGRTIFQKGVAVSLTTKMHTMRVLVFSPVGPDLDAVVNFLKCFPCLERLYVIFQPLSRAIYYIGNARKYDPLHPIECFQLHLKKVVLKNYDGENSAFINFAKFFLLNAKALKEMKITSPYHRQHNFFANIQSKLRDQLRASPDAQIELRCGTRDYFTRNKHTHDLSMNDPFDMPSIGCWRCKELGLGDTTYQV
ncbi:hypothetical protein VPH35_009894 [Triticum aestivum]|uniref:F-box/FBD/LRR-repeat protein At1g16930 n=1 Tax=Triticum aestivum TaxID=4565 RepID=UPI0008436652|nr:F-box/FBD/LRR-repeat protein At1g16930-like [Triticum aestivum]